MIERVERLSAAGSEPPIWLLAGERFDDLDRLAHDRALILDLLDRHLHVAVCHELPARIARGRRHFRVGLADLGIDRHGRPHPRIASARMSRQKPTRIPYSYQVQFGMSGMGVCPMGGCDS